VVGAVPTAAAGRRRWRGPAAAGCRRPAPARSSGRPVRVLEGAGWSSRGSVGRADGVLQVEPADVRPPEKVQVRWAGPAHHSHSTFGVRVRAGTRWTGRPG
jgi:hypothetical protein